MCISASDFSSLKGVQLEAGESRLLTIFKSVSIDSRNIHPGALFFAIKGERFDGHDFVEAAVDNGATGVVVAQDFEVPAEDKWKNIFIAKVPDTHDALKEYSSIHRAKFDIPVIGITGTNGKTTTKEMVTAVLSHSKKVMKTKGNLNNQYGLPITLFTLTTQHDAAVVEMGASYPGEIAELCDIAHPTHGIITNAGRGHLEFFGSVEQVIHTKSALAKSLPYDGKGFVNGDEPGLSALKESQDNITTFGFAPENDIRAENIGIESHGGYSFSVNGKLDITLKVPGKQMIYNALAAVAAGFEFGIPDNDIAAALSEFDSFSQRMEIMKWNDITIINDSYNANPDSMTAALELLQEYPATGRRYAALGDMLELGKTSRHEHESIGREIVQRGIKRLITVGTDSAYTSETVNIMGLGSAIHATGHEQAARLLKREMKKGDVLLIKGSRGSAMEKTLEHLTGKAKG